MHVMTEISDEGEIIYKPRYASISKRGVSIAFFGDLRDDG